MNETQDRINGILYGLAAGDRNGGPTAMALCLAKSLLEQSKFDPDDVLKYYLAWWQAEGFDTGPVSAYVFSRVAQGIPYQQATRQVHLAMGEQTAGCNPAHRIAPVAMASFIEDTLLSQIANNEAALTHWDALAGDVSALVLRFCRSLIRGGEWFRTVEAILPNTVYSSLQQKPHLIINRGGFAPDVLHTAVYFVNKHSDFESALSASIQYAGPANYCPVLVGVFAGVRWGRSAISDDLLGHCQHLKKDFEQIARSFSIQWK